MNHLESEEALEFINKNKQNPDFILLDIRRKRDFQKNRIDGAINIPYFDEDFDRKLKKLDRNKIYLVYYSADAVSNITVETMDELDFKNVNKIAGGISRWHKNGLRIISSIKVDYVI
ncbi:MAG: rhodanese-like domain-containing protein [Candidatus Cloacimonadales bacterium]|nr:rhodanese-like domain-containing protein [Candidatus Cloacimonadales bacterium]